MKTILLAGGLGTRVSHLYPDIPKPMIPIDGKPFISYLINWLLKNKIEEKDIIISTGHKSEKIIEYFGDRFKYSNEDIPLGTSGALYKVVKDYNLKNEMFLVINADTFCSIKLNDIYYKYNNLIYFKSGAIVVKEVENNDRYGSIESDNLYRITSFNERGNGKYINLGIYIFNTKLTGNFFLPKGSLEKDLFPNFLDFYVIPIPKETEFIDIGTEETLKRVDEWKKILL